MIGFGLAAVVPVDQLDPALEFVKQFAGGQWEAHFDQMTAKLQFKVILDGKSIEGNGQVVHDLPPGSPKNAQAKPILALFTRFGYDALSKTVYVLDIHNDDTIYKGTGRLEGKTFVNDFKAIVGTPGHWIQRTTLADAETMESVLYTVEDSGTEKEIERFTFKRKKSK